MSQNIRSYRLLLVYCKIWEEENAKDIEWGFFNYDPCDSVIYEDLKTPGTEIDGPNDLVEAKRNPCTNEQAKALLLTHEITL